MKPIVHVKRDNSNSNQQRADVFQKKCEEAMLWNYVFQSENTENKERIHSKD